MKRHTLSDRHCALARAGAELVDGWTFVILREVMLFNRKFSGIQEQTGMNPISLTKRLQSLIDVEILETQEYSEKSSRVEYCLTEKGEDLWPALIMLKTWADRWSDDWSVDDPPLKFSHGDDDHLFSAVLACGDCGESVYPTDVRAELSEAMVNDRLYMKQSNKR